MKNLIIKNGRAIIDISAYVALVLVVLVALGVMTQANFFAGIVSLLVGLVGFVLTYFFIYLLIDMRDTLKAIAEQGGIKSE